MMRTRARLVLATVVGMLATGAISTAAAGPAQAATPRTIEVRIDASHHLHMTQHMHPGVHRFHIGSATAAAFQLLRVHGDYTKQMLVHDVKTGLATEDSSSPAAIRAIKRFERHVTLAGGVASVPSHRSAMWVDVRRGTYWAVDTEPAVPTVDQILALHVGGARVAGTMPGGPVLRAIHETTWAPNPASIPRQGKLTFRNDSEDNHFLAMARLAKGKTFADWKAWVRKAKSGQNPGQPPFDRSAGIETGVISPGHELAVRYDIRPGRWVIMCWWPDAEMGGMPHAFMGMSRLLRVT